MSGGSRILYFSGGRSYTRAVSIRKIGAIIDCWKALGYEVESAFGGDLAGGTDAGQQAIQRLPWYRRTALFNPLANSVSERRDILHDRVCAEHLRKIVKRQRFDFIWERSCRLHSAGLVVAREIGIPYILEWKDNLIRYRYSWYRSLALETERRKNREADCLVVESEVLREQLANEGVAIDKIVVAQNAVNPGLFRRDPVVRAESRRKLGIADNEVLAAFVGGYQFYHDAIRLVLAANILRAKDQRKLKILMLGEGPEYCQTRSLAEKLGLLSYDRFMMKPWVAPSEVPGILAALDIAILPGSTDIICPIKVQEYMAAELPTVLPDYRVHHEVIDPGETGLFFTPKDAESLAEALDVLTEDDALRSRMGARSRQVVCERFTWEKTWGAALAQAIQKTKPPIH